MKEPPLGPVVPMKPVPMQEPRAPPVAETLAKPHERGQAAKLARRLRILRIPCPAPDLRDGRPAAWHQSPGPNPGWSATQVTDETSRLRHLASDLASQIGHFAPPVALRLQEALECRCAIPFE
jgi:hypothetical protein